MAILDNEFQLSIHAEGLDHAEGIAWGLDGYVYAGGEAGQIYRIGLDGNSLTEIANTGGFVLGLALDASNNIYACDIYNKCVQKITPEEPFPFTRMVLKMSHSPHQITRHLIAMGISSCVTRVSGKLITGKFIRSVLVENAKFGTVG